MSNVPKFLLGIGVILIIVGVIWMLLSRFINLGRLPGDVAIEKGNFKFYFPIVTCILISVVLSIISFIIRLFMK
ncbi:DUF2905 domain-containing protein [Paenibacillus mesophilus]|uniref:DUF2905 domain-containing protein n=1 Tax=Paenibacillus mesophilus TaxID=2582849 RepID=UPI00110E7ECF|nr:DUF2905 domain-containing protein [Paenibacillus mesophilus]TMV45313.1 DUF2905 domain-containing protein [Paenibacillus mesophilus]